MKAVRLNIFKGQEYFHFTQSLWFHKPVSNSALYAQNSSFDHVSCDSEISLVEWFERDGDIKLPSRFKMDTPIVSYILYWANSWSVYYEHKYV